MDLPTYTSIWRIEKRLYKLYDFRLPFPVPVVTLGVTVAIFVAWAVLMRLIGVQFAPPVGHIVWIVPPLVLAFLATRTFVEGKRPTELAVSYVRYSSEAAVYCRLAPEREPREIVVTTRVWHRHPQAPPLPVLRGSQRQDIQAAQTHELGRDRPRQLELAPELEEFPPLAQPVAQPMGALTTLPADEPPAEELPAYEVPDAEAVLTEAPPAAEKADDAVVDTTTATPAPEDEEHAAAHTASTPTPRAPIRSRPALPEPGESDSAAPTFAPHDEEQSPREAVEAVEVDSAAPSEGLSEAVGEEEPAPSRRQPSIVIRSLRYFGFALPRQDASGPLPAAQRDNLGTSKRGEHAPDPFSPEKPPTGATPVRGAARSEPPAEKVRSAPPLAGDTEDLAVEDDDGDTVDWFSDLRRSSGDTPWQLRSKGAYAPSDTAPLPPPTPRSKAAGEDAGVEESARERAQRAIDEQERREQEELDRRRRSVAARRRAEELMSSAPAEERDSWLGHAATEGEDGGVDLGGERARAQLRGRAQGALTAREHQMEQEAAAGADPVEDARASVHERESATPPAVREQARGLGMPAEPEEAEPASAEVGDAGPKQRPHAAPWELPADYWDEKDANTGSDEGTQASTKPALELDHATDEQESFAESSGLPVVDRDSTDAADDGPPSWETHVSRRQRERPEERAARSHERDDRPEVDGDAVSDTRSAPDGPKSGAAADHGADELSPRAHGDGPHAGDGADPTPLVASVPEEQARGAADAAGDVSPLPARGERPEAGESADAVPANEAELSSSRAHGDGPDNERLAEQAASGAVATGAYAPDTGHEVDGSPDLPVEHGRGSAADAASSAAPGANTAPAGDSAPTATSTDHEATPGTETAIDAAADTNVADSTATGTETESDGDSDVGPPVSRGSRGGGSAHVAAADLGRTPDADADADTDAESARPGASDQIAGAHSSQKEGLAALRGLGVDTPVGGIPSAAEADNDPESARAAKPELQLDHGTGEHLSMAASSGPNRSAVEPSEADAGAEPAQDPTPELQGDRGTGEHLSVVTYSEPNRAPGGQPEADDETMDPDVTPVATDGFPRRGGPSPEQHYPHVAPKPPLELDHATDEQRSFAEALAAPERADDTNRRTIEEIEAAENAALLARQKATKSTAATTGTQPEPASAPAADHTPNAERPSRITRSGRLSRAMRAMPTGPQSEALPLDPAEVLAAQAADAASAEEAPSTEDREPVARKSKATRAKPLTQLDHGTGEQSALTASGRDTSGAPRPPARANGSNGANGSATSTGRPAANRRSEAAKPAAAATDRPAAESGGRKTPTSGWRRFAQAITGARNEPTLDLPQEYAERLRAPIARPQSVVVLGCTGGAGQSMTTLLLGHTLASYRDDRVVAVDANPSQGGMSRRVNNGSGETLTSLLATGGDLTGYQSMRGFTTVTATGLEVVGTKDDPYVQTLDDADYSGLVDLLARFYTISLVDPAATGVARALPVADALVLVAPASTDAARSVAMTFEWLDGHGYGGLRSRAVLVLNGVSKRTVDDVAAAERMARGQCRAVVRTPWDEHVSDGKGEVAVNSLRPITRKAYGALGGVVVAGLAASEEARR